MTISYKVWIMVEEFDEDTGEGTSDVDLPFASEVSFDTIEEAVDFAQAMHDANYATNPGEVPHN